MQEQTQQSPTHLEYLQSAMWWRSWSTCQTAAAVMCLRQVKVYFLARKSATGIRKEKTKASCNINMRQPIQVIYATDKFGRLRLHFRIQEFMYSCVDCHRLAACETTSIQVSLGWRYRRSRITRLKDIFNLFQRVQNGRIQYVTWDLG